MTERRTPDQHAGGGDPAGIEHAAVCAALHRKAGADPEGARLAALAGIALLAVPAFERALRDDLVARHETRWLAGRRRSDASRREAWLKKLPVPLRVRLRRAGEHSRDMIRPHLTRPGNRPRQAINVLVAELAQVWRVVTGTEPQRRHTGDGRHSASEAFILLAVQGIHGLFARMPAASRSTDAESQLQSLTLNGIATRLKPRKSTGKSAARIIAKDR